MHAAKLFGSSGGVIRSLQPVNLVEKGGHYRLYCVEYYHNIGRC